MSTMSRVAQKGARRLVASLVGPLLALSPAATQATEGARDRLQISIEFPAAGQRVGGVDGRGLIAGRVIGYEGDLDRYDVVFVIDVSSSTDDPSGLDVDGDGKASDKKRDRARRRVAIKSGWKGNPDNILGAEIAAVRTLLDKLDPRSTRAGVVIFSGDDVRSTPDAFVETPLTNDHGRVRKALDEIALAPPDGGTNMADGIRTALRELRKRKGKSPESGDAKRYIVFLTDGAPSLPYRSDSDLTADALEAAEQAARRGVRILSFAVGADAIDGAKVPLEMARITRGRFVAVRDLSKLKTVVSSVSFSGLDSLMLRNRTLDAGPVCQILTPEGRFAALLPMRPGTNVLEVRARSTQESEEAAEVEVELTPGASLTSDLDDAQRNELSRLRTICERPPSERNVEIETDE